MKTLNEKEINQVNGAGINIGTAVFALIAGAVMGGPVGLGVAASAIVGAEGINNLVDLYKH